MISSSEPGEDEQMQNRESDKPPTVSSNAESNSDAPQHFQGRRLPYVVSHVADDESQAAESKTKMYDQSNI